ncbi:MAG: two-component system, OmpR family, phosphate regulon sensor histidine kinase PhoR [Gammaproteobacteria bacterium]|nr:two-component system, OmpR family, phosphate regulon sensor histidine kinase PhoR [Gammaproteobacteria bacterium]
MLERLKKLWSTLWPDPGKTSLGWWLVAIHVAIVLLVGGGISYSAIGMLRDLADDQGKARVQLAGAMAREDLRRMVEDAGTAARVLAEQPTLQRLLSQGRTDAIPPILRRACETAGMDGCSVFTGTQLTTQSGPPLDWQGIVTDSTEQGATFMALPSNIRTPVLGAYASLGDTEGSRVFVVRLLNDKLARSLTQQVGVEVKLIDYRSFTNDPVNAFTPLYSAALADGRSAVQRINSQGVYASCVPIFASTGEAIALIEVLLPTAAIDTSSSHLTHKLLVTALILAVLAVFAGVILSELIAGPVKALTEAAVRLGQGDFSASIPPGGAAEVGALARTMEDMRRNLVDLTGTLRRREAEAQAVLGGIVEGVYAVDKDRFIRYLNPQAARLLGVTPEQAVGRFCGDVLKPRNEDGRRPCDYQCPILQARANNSAKAVEHLQAASTDARTTVITSSGIVDGLQVQVIRDETELEAVRRARDTVLANISHEFRTPLAAQLASIELLLEGMETLQPAQQKELVLSLERGALRLTRLIDNLLESVRIESGQLNIRHQSVDLAEVIDDAQALIGSLLTLRRQTLEVTLPENLPYIEGDLPRLTQVFVNLLANANKFAPEDSMVRIGAEAGDGHVIAWVEDEGPGPEAGESEAIFARFQRGSGEEPEPGGLGLGLWIVKSIIDRHTGTISMVRTEQGRTRFIITLPTEVTA